MLVVGGAPPRVASSSDLQIWEITRLPGTSFDSAWSIEHGANRYATGISNGKFATAPGDLSAWTDRSADVPLQNNIRGIAYSPDLNLWVAVDERNDEVPGIATSPDAITWTGVTYDPGDVRHFQSATWADGHFAVATSLGMVTYSVDGETWRESDTGLVQPIYDVSFGNGLWVAVSDFGGVATSPDLAAWTIRRAVDTATPETRNNVVRHADGMWVVGRNWGARILTSLDGIAWTEGTVGLAGNTSLYGLAHDGTNWIVVGSYARYATSPDGVDWTPSETLIWDDSTDAMAAFHKFAYVPPSIDGRPGRPRVEFE